MTPKTVGFKLGLIVAGLHLVLVLLTMAAVSGSQSSTAGLAFLPFFFLDAPVLLLEFILPEAAAQWLLGHPLLAFGLLGSALWFVLPWLLDRLLVRLVPNARHLVRWIVGVAALPAIVFFLFGPLSTYSIGLSVRNERPDELKPLLNRESQGPLAKSAAWEDPDLGGICGIYPLPDGILLACHRGTVRLDSTLKPQSRVLFSNYFQSVVPVMVDGIPTGDALVHKHLGDGALLGPDGAERWQISGDSETGVGFAGAASGDLDGDGRPEFAFYHTYRNGVRLLDEAGATRWTRPLNPLDHLVMADVRANGKQEIVLHDNRFKTLDAEGQVVDQLDLPTASSHFALVNWPGHPDRPHLLLSEENAFRLVALDGTELLRLDAPGCRGYGEFAATPVILRPGEPAALAVRKHLHPDLAVLYVFDADGPLLQQDVETTFGGTPALAAIPDPATGAQRLLVGSRDGFQPRLLLFSRHSNQP